MINKTVSFLCELYMNFKQHNDVYILLWFVFAFSIGSSWLLCSCNSFISNHPMTIAWFIYLFYCCSTIFYDNYLLQTWYLPLCFLTPVPQGWIFISLKAMHRPYFIFVFCTQVNLGVIYTRSKFLECEELFGY